jgi:hypothetical protein
VTSAARAADWAETQSSSGSKGGIGYVAWLSCASTTQYAQVHHGPRGSGYAHLGGDSTKRDHANAQLVQERMQIGAGETVVLSSRGRSLPAGVRLTVPAARSRARPSCPSDRRSGDARQRRPPARARANCSFTATMSKSFAGTAPSPYQLCGAVSRRCRHVTALLAQLRHIRLWCRPRSDHPDVRTVPVQGLRVPPAPCAATQGASTLAHQHETERPGGSGEVHAHAFPVIDEAVHMLGNLKSMSVVEGDRSVIAFDDQEHVAN